MPRLAILLAGALLVALSATGQARAQAIFQSSPSPPCGVSSAAPCQPAGCGIFHDRPCFPDYGPPVGETSWDRLPRERRDEGQLINTLHDLFRALRVCWLPPPPEKSRPGMEYTIRFAFKSNGELMAPARMTYSTHGVSEEVRNIYQQAAEAALRRCTPMHFSSGMAGAIAGKSIAFRFIDSHIAFEHFRDGDDHSK